MIQASVIEEEPEQPATVRPVALLCPGPSLKDTWNDVRDFPRHALVVAVNDACWKPRSYRHHWLVGTDQRIYDALHNGINPRPLVGVVGNKARCGEAKRMNLRTVYAETLQDGHVIPKGTSYSMVAALWWANKEADRLGVHVEIHGYDASQRASVGGIHAPGSHQPCRWRSEASFLRHLWRRTTVCHGLAPKSLLAYLRHETDVCVT